MTPENEGSDAAQFHFEPETYAEMIRADVPRYEELQRAAIELTKIGKWVERVPVRALLARKVAALYRQTK